MNISGRVSELRFDVGECRTEIIIDGWGAPSRTGNGGGHAKAKCSAEPSGQTIDQPSKPAARTLSASSDRSIERRTAQGSTGARPGASNVGGVADEATGFRRIIAKATSLQSGMHCRYKGKTISGKFTTDASGDVDATEFGQVASTEDCVIQSFVPLPLNVPIVCDAGPANDDGKLILFADAAGRTFDVVVVSTVGSGGMYTAQLLQPGVAVVPESGNLAASSFGIPYTPSTGYTRVLALNAPEIGKSTHALDSGTICKATFLNLQDNNTLVVSIQTFNTYDCPPAGAGS